MVQRLKVTSVRYFETRRGLGYECKTNIKGLSIWNDGNGGGTYFSSNDNSIVYSEQQLESLIDEYENVKTKH
jgi:hypothetical protein